MSATRTDLTRWNRAGLARFRYTDGNAANWLDQLRADLRTRLADAAHPAAAWALLDEIAEDASAAEVLAHLTEQYLKSTGDHSWEILRAFARAAHVCTEHLDAYTNEGYLRTATQWESLRRLVAMLDYSPTPAASASTPAALEIEEGVTGTVEAGLQLNDKPDEGAPLTFETLEDLDVDWRLNAVRIADWDKSQVLVSFSSGSKSKKAEFPISEAVEGLSAGSYAVLEWDLGDGSLGELVPLKITGISDDSITIEDRSGAGGSYARHGLRLHLMPKVRAQPLLAEKGSTLVFYEAGAVAVGDMLAWNESGSKYTRYVKVTATDGRRVAVVSDGGSPPLPPAESTLYKMMKVNGTEGDVSVPLYSDRTSKIVDNWFNNPGTDLFQNDEGTSTHRVLAYQSANAPYWYSPSPATEFGVVELDETVILEFSGKPKGLATGDPVLLENGDSVAADRVKELKETDDGFVLTLEEFDGSSNPLAVYWDFESTVQPLDHDVNDDTLTGQTTLALELSDDAGWPELLDVTRPVVLHDPTLGIAQSLAVAAVDTQHLTLTLDGTVAKALDADGVEHEFTKHGTVILANVVDAGHGESKNPRVLGSGDSTQTEPEFDLEFDDISFVPDATMPHGVRADVAVSIGARTWTQVGTIRDSSPNDAHYDTRTLQGGGLRFRFNGRLPTGSNNVVVRVRRGNGERGNLARGSLVKLKQPHRLVSAVTQPFDATGGSELEPTSSLRENAPESVLTLDRAVSISDFAALAAGHASVWQAQAVAARADRPARFRGETVVVFAVPSGGGELLDLRDDLRAMLQSRAMPGVVVKVRDYTRLEFDLDIRVRIDTDEYEPDPVRLAVSSALAEAFGVEQRPLAGGLFRSQIYTVEAVEGVRDSVCRIVNPPDDPLPAARVSVRDGVIRALRAGEGELLCVRNIVVTHTEYVR